MPREMSFLDRLFRSLFVALAVGLGWGIRGDFGGVMGAMYPGACLGLGFAYVSGQREAWRWAPALGALSAYGISRGGMMSYGILHGYAKSDTFINYTANNGPLITSVMNTITSGLIKRSGNSPPSASTRPLFGHTPIVFPSYAILGSTASGSSARRATCVGAGTNSMLAACSPVNP